MKLSHSQIKDIVEELDCGMKCYINKETGEIKPILDSDDMYDDTGTWEAELEQIEKNWKDYVVIEKMPSREAFEVMESFAENISEKEIRDRLIYALNRLYHEKFIIAWE